MGNAVERAYRAIRQAIVTGVFRPGFHLKEEELAARTELSRTPIREAMRRLHSEGWVNVVPNRGVFVSSFDRRDVEEVFNIRLLLETYAAELAATRLTPDQLHLLRTLNLEMEMAAEGDLPGCLEAVAKANDSFHKLILRASGSRRLQVVLSLIIEVPLVFSTFNRYSRADLTRSLAYHRELIDAFEARDGTWAHSAMAGHIRSAFHVFDTRPVGESALVSSLATKAPLGNSNGYQIEPAASGKRRNDAAQPGVIAAADGLSRP